MITRSNPSTRSREGARRRLMFFGLLALAVAAPWPLRAAEEDDGEGPGPLPWRVHGQVSFTVDAAAFPDSAGSALEIYVRVPPGTIRTLERDPQGVARLRLSTRLSNRFGARARTATEEFSIVPAESGGDFGKVVLLRFPARSGAHRLNVKLEDMQSRKRGLGYIGRRVRESSAVEGDLQIPGPEQGRELSDLEFLWPPAGTAGKVFQRGDSTALPNPERLYGLFASEVRAQFSARGPAGDARPWRWHARVLDPGGRTVAEQESTGAAGSRFDGRVTLDVSSQPAGGYELELKVWQEGDAGALVRSARFSIGWEVPTWLMDPGDAEDAVHFLLSSADEQRFHRFQPGERERFLEDFWRRRDPSPDTAENEARTDFFRRVEYANAHYGGLGVERGMFSDMGRVYIRYGEPDEIQKEVIPTDDQTLTRVIRELEASEDRPTGDVHQKGMGGDTRAYELWIYQGDIAAPPDADPSVSGRLGPRRRLVFLFVDEQGYGLYTLRYSTE